MKNFILFILLINIVYANETVTKTDTFPPKEMVSQKKIIIDSIVKEYSKDLPHTIDKYTSLVSIKAKKSAIDYTFEINSPTKSDEEIIKEDNSRMKEAIVLGICNSSKKLLDADIDTAYNYISAKSKAPLFTFHISKKDCKAPSR